MVLFFLLFHLFRILLNFIFGFYTEQLTNGDQWKVIECSDRMRALDLLRALDYIVTISFGYIFYCLF